MDFYDVYDDLNESDEYDEFLFESIRRYNTLQMFELEHIPYHLFQIDDTSICITSKHKNNSEILKLQLPVKLTVPPEEEGRSKGNDFKVLSLLYSDNLVYNINKLVKSEKIVTSEYNVNGLKMYTFSDSLSGSKSMTSKFSNVPWSASDFVMIEERNCLICSKNISEPLIQIDASSGEKIKEINHPFRGSNMMEKEADYVEQNNIKCQVLRTDLIAVLSTYSAELVLHDLRTNDSFVSLPGVKSDKEIWTVSGCELRESSPNSFGILSNRKSFCIYDTRTNSIFIQSKNSGNLASNPSNLRLKFCEKSNKFSISGMNSTVEVFKIMENDFHHVFTHDGHCPSNSPSTFVTDHIWLNSGGKEFVVSICDNKTLNCWDYKT